MILSLILSYIISIGALLAKKPYRIVFFSISSVLIVYLLGFRVGFGTDYWNYIPVIQYYHDYGSFAGGSWEPSFYFINWLSREFGFDPNFVVFAYFAITYFCLVKAFWSSSPYYALSFLIMVCVAPLYSSLNIMRQALAFSLVLVFLVLAPNKRWKFGFIVVLAVSYFVHATVAILVLIPVFRRLPSRFSFWLFLIVVCFFGKLLTPLLIPIIIDIYSQSGLPYADYLINTRYLYTSRSDTGILQYINVALVLWGAYKLPKMDENYIHSVICKTYLVGLLLTFSFVDFQAFVRIFLNYTWLGFIALPIFLSYYKSFWLKVFSLYGLVAYCLILGFVKFISLYENFGGGQHLHF